MSDSAPVPIDAVVGVHMLGSTPSWSDWRLLVECVVDYAIIVLDLDGRILTWNVGAERLKGYAADEVLGAHFSKLYTPEDVAARKPEHELEVAREVGRAEDAGWRLRKDGTRFWAHVVLTALRDERGVLRGFGKVTREAAPPPSRHALDALGTPASSRRLVTILDALGDGISIQTADGRIVYANLAAARACGFSSADELVRAGNAEILARFEITDEDGRPFPVDELPGRRVLRGEPPCDVVLGVRERATGRTWWSRVHAAPILDDAGRPEMAINVWSDATALRRRALGERFLAQASAALASSLDYRATLDTTARLLVPELADWCVIHLLERDQLAPVALAHVDPAKVVEAREIQRRFPPDPRQTTGVWQVVRTGRSELYQDVTDAMLVAGAHDAEHLALLREVGLTSIVVVPIRGTEDVVLGTLSLVSAESARRFDADDVRLAEELGRRAGSAIEHARLFTAARRAEERLHLALECGRMGVWQWQLPTGEVTWSPSLERIHGIPEGSFGGTFADYERDIHPDDRARVRESIERTVAGRGEHHLEYRIVLPDGTTRWVDAHGHLFRDARGAPRRGSTSSSRTSSTRPRSRTARSRSVRRRRISPPSSPTAWRASSPPPRPAACT